jgi:hypothetical protein
VPASVVAKAAFEASARRCATDPFVFCAVDGSSLTLVDRKHVKFGPLARRDMQGRGLKVMSALAISPQGVPEGITSQAWWARRERRARKKRWARPIEQKETGRWLDVMKGTREVMRAHAPGVRVWFQLDREGDCWEILQQADADGHWFTVRGRHDRRIIVASGKRTYLRRFVKAQRVVNRYELAVPGGPHRSARTAVMEVRACAVELDFEHKRTSRHVSKTVNVVLVREVDTTPRGESPIEWLLLTSHSIVSDQDLANIVFGYSMRWRIEEFHRCWKSGACHIEDSQLRSPEAVRKWATIHASVAVRIERLKKLSRSEPDRPATDEFRPIELRAIKLLRFGKKAKARLSDATVPSLAEATLWLAEIGGYTGKSSGGPPGTITLSRGLDQVGAAVRALEALDPSCG